MMRAFGFKRLVCCLALCSAFLVPPSAFSSSVPSAINYQGKLTDNQGAALPAGAYEVAFRIWNDPTADAEANLIWGREYPLNIMTGGVFNIILSDNGGEVDDPEPAEQHLIDAFKDQDRFLGMTVTRTPSGDVSDPAEISPRQRLVSAPYCFAAEVAHRAPDSFTVGGALEVAKGAWVSNGISLQSGNLALQGNWISHDGSSTGLTIDASGRVGIGTTNTPVALQVAGDIYDKTGYLMPVGAVLPFVGSGATPKGWLFCDGSAISRTTYAELYSVIGTHYGAGDGSSTFNLPDMRGRVPIGAGTGAGLTERTLGEKVGAETHTLTIDEIPSHTHTYNVPDRRNYGYHGSSGPNDGVNKGLSQNNTVPAGGGSPHSNMQPGLALNYIIKY